MASSSATPSTVAASRARVGGGGARGVQAAVTSARMSKSQCTQVAGGPSVGAVQGVLDTLVCHHDFHDVHARGIAGVRDRGAVRRIRAREAAPAALGDALRGGHDPTMPHKGGQSPKVSRCVATCRPRTLSGTACVPMAGCAAVVDPVDARPDLALCQTHAWRGCDRPGILVHHRGTDPARTTAAPDLPRGRGDERRSAGAAGPLEERLIHSPASPPERSSAERSGSVVSSQCSAVSRSLGVFTSIVCPYRLFRPHLPCRSWRRDCDDPRCCGPDTAADRTPRILTC